MILKKNQDQLPFFCTFFLDLRSRPEPLPLAGLFMVLSDRLFVSYRFLVLT